MIYQYFVQQPFISCSPTFLGRLQLDGYCKKYELAFEYNGIQHYTFQPFFHKTYEGFDSQLKRDYRKKELCKRYGLILMVVPYQYTWKTVPPMASFIYSELRKAEQLRKEKYIHIYKISK
jgi:hypothetical protein